MPRRKYLSPDQILALLRNIEEDVSECEDSGSESDAYDSESESDASYRPELDSGDDTDNDELEEDISGSVNSGLDSSECARKRPRIEGQVEATVLPRESYSAAASAYTSQAEQESSLNVELAPGTSQTRVTHQRNLISGSGDVAQNDDTVGHLIAPDGTKWHQLNPGEHSFGRFSKQNVLLVSSGPSPYAKRSVCAGSPASAWRLLIDNYIVRHITKCTVTEAHRQMQNQTFALTIEELERFIAVMYARGVTGKSSLPLHELWSEKWGVPLCKTAMARNRFCEILRFLRFDVKSGRSQRLQTDKFALFSEVWNRFISNCIACYKPGPFITVDEQLFPSKARCPFTQFMASKPDKYGQKYWLAVDKDSKYLVNGFPYLGKDETRATNERVADHVVMQLMQPFLNKGRTDNYFTSVKLATQLKKKQTSLLGTVNKIRREVPLSLRKKKEELHSSKLYKSGDITLTV